VETSYGDRVIYIYQDNRGPSAARNLGFINSHGELIGFLDSDDYYLPENISKKVGILNENLDIGWVFSDWYEIDDKGTMKRSPLLEKMKTVLEKEENIFPYLIFHGGGLTQTNVALIRRPCISNINGFDENFRSLEDVDFFIRLSRYYKTKYIHIPLIVRTMQPDSLQEDRKIGYEASLRLMDKIERNYPEEVKNLKIKRSWAKWRSNVYNYFGAEHLKCGQYQKARQDFLTSIRSYPLQKKVYLLFLKTFLYGKDNS
jgi:glycosyltransferase involved in cell wall biosynthesis